MENCYIESFNGRLRDECLNVNVFGSLEDAARILSGWRPDYNDIRSHSALDGHTPNEFLRRFEAASAEALSFDLVLTIRQVAVFSENQRRFTTPMKLHP